MIPQKAGESIETAPCEIVAYPAGFPRCVRPIISSERLPHRFLRALVPLRSTFLNCFNPKTQRRRAHHFRHSARPAGLQPAPPSDTGFSPWGSSRGAFLAEQASAWLLDQRIHPYPPMGIQPHPSVRGAAGVAVFWCAGLPGLRVSGGTLSRGTGIVPVKHQGQDAHARTRDDAVILIFLCALRALCGESFPPRRRGYTPPEKKVDNNVCSAITISSAE